MAGGEIPAAAGESLTLGVIPGPVGSGPNKGTYIDLLIHLELSDDADRMAVSRSLPKLRDAVLLVLHARPLNNHPDGGLDLDAAAADARAAIIRVIGSRSVQQVVVERLKIQEFCGGRSSVKSWRKKCN